MELQLPVLTRDVDCEPLGYPGVVVTMRLNRLVDDHEWPWQHILDDPKWDDIEDDKDREDAIAKAVAKFQRPLFRAKPWEAYWYYAIARVVERVTLPANMVEGDEPWIVDLPDARAAHALMMRQGFDQKIITWAMAQYDEHYQSWLEAETKN